MSTNSTNSATVFSGSATMPSIPAVSMKTSRFKYFDIESLHNIFTVAVYDSQSHHVDLFYLFDHDTPEITVLPHSLTQLDPATRTRIDTAIIKANPALAALKGSPIGPEDISLHNLNDVDPQQRWSANVALANSIGGVSVPFKCPYDQDTNHAAQHFANQTMIVRDFDPQYDPENKHPFIAGFNSISYDSTMLAIYFGLLTQNIGSHGSHSTYFPLITAAEMRRHNDTLFSTEFIKNMPKYLWDRNNGAGIPAASGIRNAMLKSGRHVDIQRLNEKQIFTGLKRMLGLLGHQILESDKLSGENARVDTDADVLELLAYNASDVVGTSLLANHPVYSGTFDLRAGLLSTYPETVFDHDGSFRQSSGDMRNDRLTVNTSSAQFAARILAPYRPLRDVPNAIGDMPVVSFLYPDATVAAQTGQKQVNVLDESKKFFYETITDPAARAQFDEVFAFYADIEGRNFNHHNQSMTHTINVLRNHLFKDVHAFDATAYQLYDVQTRFEQIFPSSHSYINDPADNTPRAVSAFSDLVQLCEDIRAVLDRGLQVTGENHYQIIDTMNKQLIYIREFYRAWSPVQRRFNDANNTMTTPELTVIYPPMTAVSADKFTTMNNVSAVQKRPTTLPYFRADGFPTRGYATFSTGGIHGAEYNDDRFSSDIDNFDTSSSRFFNILGAAITAMMTAQQPDHPDHELARTARDWAKTVLDDGNHTEKSPELHNPATKVTYPREIVAMAAWWIRNKPVEIQDHTGETITVKHAEVLAAASRKNTPYWRSEPKGTRQPTLFPQADNGSSKLDAKYAYTSAGTAIHEDFTSYYPLLLTNMAAFVNSDLGVDEKTGRPRDRYSDIFEQKEIYGAQLKDPSIDEATRDRLGVLREGTKLILNSATGAADAGHDTPILMNNRVIAMRIIGQLFSWRIGQAQTLAGATIISTNTDGLYSVLDMETNQRVLDEHASAIGVEIEPEELDIVTKDSNSRAEFLANGRINAAGDLACWNGPNPRQSLDHPAFTDYVLVKYFQLTVNKVVPEVPELPELEGVPLDLSQPMNRNEVNKIVAAMQEEFEPTKLLSFYQNILASSRGSNSFLFAVPYLSDLPLYSPQLQEDGSLSNTNHPATNTTTIATPELTIVDNEAVYVMPQESTATSRVPALLDYYTRTFHIKPETDQQTLDLIGTRPVLIAAAKAASISATTATARKKRGDAATTTDRVAAHILGLAGADVDTLRHTKDLKVTKHTGQDPTLPVVVFNDTIEHNPNKEVINALIEAIDHNAYIDMTIQSYNNSWRNTLA